VATPRWVGPCRRLPVYRNLPMRIRQRSVQITRPLGCRGQLPNTQGSLVAQAGSSHGTYLLEALVRWGY
jgi:hypothetical protein